MWISIFKIINQQTFKSRLNINTYLCSMEKITAKPPKKKGKQLLYPFNTIEPGEALLLTVEESKDKRKVNSFISAAYQYATRNHITFKRGTENGQTGIYRTK